LGDNPQPRLPDDQQALIAALEATGKPVIVVVIAGRSGWARRLTPMGC
jgi:beta-glucosidase